MDREESFTKLRYVGSPYQTSLSEAGQEKYLYCMAVHQTDQVLCVCMCVCMYVCMYICMHIYAIDGSSTFIICYEHDALIGCMHCRMMRSVCMYICMHKFVPYYKLVSLLL